MNEYYNKQSNPVASVPTVSAWTFVFGPKPIYRFCDDFVTMRYSLLFFAAHCAFAVAGLVQPVNHDGKTQSGAILARDNQVGCWKSLCPFISSYIQA